MTREPERLVRRLAAYSTCHRNARNRALHYIGIPIIVFSLLLAGSLVPGPPQAPGITGAVVAAVVLVLYYVTLDRNLAAATAVSLALMILLASSITTRLAPAPVLGIAAVLFVAGWVLQLVGHFIEGRRPALVDDFALTFVAPIYLAAESAFALGLRPRLRLEIERRLALADGQRP